MATEHDGLRHFNHPLIKKDSIEFRSYQSNIFESVKNKNSLVILPTALGKTIIAILVCAEFLYNYKSKRVLIMAPTKPLVSQHMISFISVLKMPEDGIALLTGKNLPQTRTAIWNRRETRLVFATPEVVKNDIAESRLSLDEFSLLVFDEAHRAVKDYAYTSIARYYVQQSLHPVILAMTASPGSEKERMEEVCDNLSIEKIEYRNEEDIDVKPYINPIDTTWKWFTIPQEYKYVSSSLRAMLEDKLQFLIKKGLLRKKHPKWIFKSDLLKLGEEIQYKINITIDELRGPLYAALMQQSSALTLMYCAELIESQGSQSLKSFLERIERDGGKAHRSLLNDNRIKEVQALLNSLKIDHPKTRYLVELLKQHYSFYNENNNNNNNTFTKIFDSTNKRPKALVFTHYRDTARKIAEILAQNGIKASRFVGQAKRELDIGMRQDEQSAILESFKNKEFDVLVATSIAEEGLDIPQVDLVVFYEPIPSEIRYIQRRGRTGRKSSGRVIILAAKDTIDERYLYASKRRMEKMKQILSGITMTLKPVQRAAIQTSPMTADEISSFELKNTALDNRVDKIVSAPLDITKADLLPSPESTYQPIRTMVRKQKRRELLSLESGILTNGFRKEEIDSAARRIHALIARSGRQGLDVDIIQETFTFENSISLEALKRLEKLKRIEWLDDSRVILSENLVKITGSTYDVYVEKVIQGRALVIVNEKWHARLNHYDYEGPCELLRKGSEFKVVGELYSDEGVFSLRVKQIL